MAIPAIKYLQYFDLGNIREANLYLYDSRCIEYVLNASNNPNSSIHVSIDDVLKTIQAIARSGYNEQAHEKIRLLINHIASHVLPAKILLLLLSSPELTHWYIKSQDGIGTDIKGCCDIDSEVFGPGQITSLNRKKLTWLYRIRAAIYTSIPNILAQYYSDMLIWRP
jgi:hypothetical protein